MEDKTIQRILRRAKSGEVNLVDETGMAALIEAGAVAVEPKAVDRSALATVVRFNNFVFCYEPREYRAA